MKDALRALKRKQIRKLMIKAQELNQGSDDFQQTNWRGFSMFSQKRLDEVGRSDDGDDGTNERGGSWSCRSRVPSMALTVTMSPYGESNGSCFSGGERERRVCGFRASTRIKRQGGSRTAGGKSLTGVNCYTGSRQICLARAVPSVSNALRASHARGIVTL